MSILTAIAYATGWLIGQGIRAVDAVWSAFDDLKGCGEVADLPPCGMRIVLTDEQVAASIAAMEKHFPKTKDRRIR